MRNILSGNNRGFSLLEVMIAAAVLMVIMAAVFAVLSTGQDLYHTGVTAGDLDSQARMVLDRIVDHVRETGPSAFLDVDQLPDVAVPLDLAQSPFHYSDIAFRKNIGYNHPNITWSPTVTVILYEWTGWTGIIMEVPNGVIGLPEEDQQYSTLTVWGAEFLEGEEVDPNNGIDDNGNGLVDESGLSFAFSGDLVTIRLTLARRDIKGKLIQATVETSVVLRNP